VRRFSKGAITAAVALLPSAGSADARRARMDDEVYKAAEVAWRACFSATPRVPSFPEPPDRPDDSSEPLEVRRTAGGFRVESGEFTSSVEAGGHHILRIDFEPRGCRALWADDDGFNGALAGHIEAGWVNRDPPTEAEVRSLIAEPARADDPRHGFARAWLSHRCRGGIAAHFKGERPIEGPIAPAQPAHDGLPRQAPRTFWPDAAVRAIGAGAALRWFDEEDEEEADENGPPVPKPPPPDVQLGGISVQPIERPKPTFATRRFQIFEAEIGGHNGGKAIALFDRTARRHRWVVVTRGCVQGTTVAWAGTVGDRIIGVTHSRHERYAEGDAILVIDTPTATAWAIQFPQSIRAALAEGHRDRKATASLSGATLSLTVARVKAKIDLAPLLALIPAR